MIAKSPRYISTADTAKLVRAELREVFPGVKFSVKSSIYAGGSSIDVAWTDGPTDEMVEKITKKYAGASFDGMQDLKTHHDSILDGERVSFSADYVHSHRRISDGLRLRLAAKVARYWGIALVINERGEIQNEREYFDRAGFWPDTLICQRSRKTAIVPAGVVWQERKRAESKGARTTKPKDPPAMAVVFRTYATRQREIAAELSRPRLENTYKRVNQARHMDRRAKLAGFLARAADGLADAYELNTVPASLRDVRSGAALADILTHSEIPDLWVRSRLMWELLDGAYGEPEDRASLWGYFEQEGNYRPRPEDTGIELRNLDDLARLVRICNDVPKGDQLAWQASSFVELSAPARRIRLSGLTAREWFQSARADLYRLGQEEPAPEQHQQERIKEAYRELAGLKLPGYHPTPPSVIALMLQEANIGEDMAVLEPSAGSGEIADAIAAAYPTANLSTIEIVSQLRTILELKGHNVDRADFLGPDNGERWDRIVMNPPFGDGEYMTHYRQAYALLALGGRLVGVVPQTAKVSNTFCGWLERVGGWWVDLPKDAFTESSRPTPTPCKLVVIDKTTD